MQVLFGTAYPVQKIPTLNQRVLGVSSLWILWLVAQTPHHPLCLPLLCACTASTVFWAKPVQGSISHRMDKLCVWILLLSMLVYSKTYLPMALVGICFLFSAKFADVPHMQLAAHLAFRLSFYCWVHYTMTDNLQKLPLVMAGQALHVLLLAYVFTNYVASCVIFLLAMLIVMTNSG